MLHISSTSLPLLAVKQEPYPKAYLFMKNIEEFSGRSSGEWASRQKKDKTERVTGLARKNKTGDSKVESNDSPEMPDRGRDIRHSQYPCKCTDTDTWATSSTATFPSTQTD